MTQTSNLGNSSSRLSAELENTAKDLGVKLGRLLPAFFNPEEAQAMLAVAEKMTPEQLVTFVDTLEKKYLEAGHTGLDAGYQAGLNKAANVFKEEQSRLKKIVETGLAEIEKEV